MDEFEIKEVNKDVLIKVLHQQLKSKDDQITALMLIREHYERKFGIRMHANGEFEDFRKSWKEEKA